MLACPLLFVFCMLCLCNQIDIMHSADCKGNGENDDHSQIASAGNQEATEWNLGNKGNRRAILLRLRLIWDPGCDSVAWDCLANRHSWRLAAHERQFFASNLLHSCWLIQRVEKITLKELGFQYLRPLPIALKMHWHINLIESDQMRVVTPLGLWLIRSDSYHTAPYKETMFMAIYLSQRNNIERQHQRSRSGHRDSLRLRVTVTNPLR